MKVAVNLLWCVPGQVGGSEQYLTRQLVALQEHDPIELSVFGPHGFADAHRELRDIATVVTAPIDGRSRAKRIAYESTWLAHRTRGHLVHHGGGTLPAVPRHALTVLTIHDLQYLTIPHTFSTVKLNYLKAVVPRSIRRATVITTPSEFVRGTVLESNPRVAPDRVIVVPHPIPPNEKRLGTAEATLRARYRLPGQIVLVPAITYVHKNHAVVIEALARLAKPWPDLRLVMIGGEGPNEANLRRQIERLKLVDRVIRPGRVSDEDRNGLIATATALAFPSRYEGFGAPVIEAMQSRCPVIAATSTALVEVVGDAGILVDPDDVDGWTSALDRVLRDESLRASLIQSGTSRAGDFDGRTTAGALSRAYRLARS